MSTSNSIKCGVPHGSVLGPLFFILYVNDVQTAIQGSNVQLYADDTVIHGSSEDLGVAAQELQRALDQFTGWCHENKLSLNISKTKQMVLVLEVKLKGQVKIEGVPLQLVPTYKYLGVTLDSTLSVNSHVKNVANIISYKVVLRVKIRKFLTQDVAPKIYKSMVLPYFDYGDVIYGNANQEGLEKLQRLQNKCLKICMGFNVRHGTANLHRVTKLPMLGVRRVAHVNNFMYTRLGNPSYIDNRDIRTRAHDGPLFSVKVPKIEMYKRSVKYAGAVQWNNLDPDIRAIKICIYLNRVKRP